MNMIPNNPMEPIGPPDPLDLPDPLVPISPLEEMAEAGFQEPMPFHEVGPMEIMEPPTDFPEALAEIQDAVEAAQEFYEPLTAPAEEMVPPYMDPMETAAAQYEITTPEQAPDTNPPTEHWEFPEGVTGIGPVTALKSPSETVILAPQEDLTVRLKQPHSDKLIMNRALRQEFTPEVPDRLLPDKLLRQKYGEDLTDRELEMIRAEDGRTGAEEILRLLGQAREAAEGRQP